MSNYNPFKKKISKLRQADLNILIENQVAEGWYVEYKKDFPSTNKIGHSIASFANSDGGWYIVGVEANEDNVATSILGFDITQYRRPKEKIRNIITTHLQPIPTFESKLISLSNGRVVLVVQILRGDETPYLTKDGRIYRRVGEGSDPVAETDYYSLQKLFERSMKLENLIGSFSKNPFLCSKDQNQPFLEAYFFCALFNSFQIDNFISKNFFEVMKDIFTKPVNFIKEPITAQIPFNSFYSSSGSYLMRHIPNSKAFLYIVPTLEIHKNANLKMIIPIPQIERFNDQEYQSSENLSSVFDKLTPMEFDYIKVLDGFKFFCVFIILFNQYCKLLKKVHFKGKLKARFRFTNCWRSLVFFDSKEYIDYIDKYGIPICLKDEIEIPEFYGRQGFSVDIKEKSAFFLTGLMFESLGFPLAYIGESMYGLVNYIVNLSKKTAQNLA